MCEISETEIKSMTKEQNYMCGYENGKSDVLKKIRAEIDTARFVDKETKHCRNANATGLEVAIDIIDKYKGE